MEKEGNVAAGTPEKTDNEDNLVPGWQVQLMKMHEQWLQTKSMTALFLSCAPWSTQETKRETVV